MAKMAEHYELANITDLPPPLLITLQILGQHSAEHKPPPGLTSPTSLHYSLEKKEMNPHQNLKASPFPRPDCFLPQNLRKFSSAVFV